MDPAPRQLVPQCAACVVFKGTELGVRGTETASAQKLVVMKCVTFQKSIFLELSHLCRLRYKFLTHVSGYFNPYEKAPMPLADHKVF